VWYAANARYPNIDILRALIAAHGHVSAAVQDGTTALMAAVGMAQNDARRASEPEALAIVKVLVESGIDLNAVNRNGQTALHGATRAAEDTIVRFLVEHGAALNVKDRGGRTPLDIAQDPIRPLESTAALLRTFAATRAPQ
jgi:ankyrin repeat protein